jgi:hypothetical protein
VRKLLGYLLRAAVVAGCLTYAFWGLDWEHFLHALGRYQPLALLTVLAYSMLTYLPPALRIYLLMQGAGGLGTAYGANLVALGVNNIVPAKLGEVAKVFYLRRKTGIPLPKGLGLVFWERFLDVNFVVILGVASVAVLGHHKVVYTMAGAVVVGWLTLWLVRVHPGLGAALIRLVPARRFRDFAAEVLAHLHENVGPRFLLQLVSATALVWAGYCSGVMLVLYWVAGLDLTVTQALTVFTVTALGYAVPSSPGGLGVVEAATVFGLGLFGVPKPEALAAGLVLHFMQYVPTTLAALLIMARTGLDLRSVRRSEETETAGA